MNLAGNTVAHDGCDCDVLVIGSGAGGLSAALAARACGLEVLIVEKDAVWGGASALSGGALWIPGNEVARRAGATDSPERALEYLDAHCGSRLDRALAGRYLEAAPRAAAWLEANSRLRFVAPLAYPDYHRELPGGSSGRVLRAASFDGRTLGAHFVTLRWPLAELMLLGRVGVAPEDLPFLSSVTRSPRSAWYVARMLSRYARDRIGGAARGTLLANGNALVARLGVSAFAAGVTMWLKAPARELICDAGRVGGALIERAGRRIAVRARRGVVLAAGGFSNDAAMRALHFAHVREGSSHHSLVPASCSGDGLRLGVHAGGVLRTDASDAAVWVPVSLARRAGGRETPVAHLFDRSRPGFIAVDPAGRRFANEAASYQDFVPALIAAARACGRRDAFAVLMADHRAVRRHGIGAAHPFPAPLGHHLRSGYLLRAASLRELAGRLGIDGGILAATVARYNAHAASGEDPDFGRGSTAYQRMMGDPLQHPNPCVAPLETPPFYALRLRPGDVGTCHGLRIDGFARVIDGSGEPVPGLYAAGADAASIFGGGYPGAGIMLGPAVTFGTLAGLHLGGRQDFPARESA